MITFFRKIIKIEKRHFEALNSPEWPKNTVRHGEAVSFVNRTILHQICEFRPIPRLNFIAANCFDDVTKFSFLLVMTSS